jgi:maltose operon periplasmic protein
VIERENYPSSRLCVLVALLTSGLLQGCLTLPPLGEAKGMLDRAPNCCASLSRLPFQRLPLGADVSVELNESSPAFEFASGRSFFVAFELPRANNFLTLTVKSYYSRDVFYPVVTLLNSNFEVARRVGPPDIRPIPANGERGRIQGTITILPEENERYAVIHTSDGLVGRAQVRAISPQMYPTGQGVAFLPGETIIHTFTTLGNLRILLDGK